MSENSNYERIFAVIRRIPKGRVATYGQIAALAGIPRHARQVGYALRNAPEELRLPWHRVINAQGRVSKRSPPGGHSLQYVLLDSEGIQFDVHGKIALQHYQWKPRSRVSTRAQKKTIRRKRR